MVPADQYHDSLDTGPAAVTDASIRTPAAARETAPATEDTPAAPEGTTAPDEAASRGDPSVGEGAEGEAANELESGSAKDAFSPEASDSEGQNGSSNSSLPESSKPEDDGSSKPDPIVQIGDRPGGMPDEVSSEQPEGATSEPAADVRRGISKSEYKYLRDHTPSKEIQKAIKKNMPTLPYADPALPGLEVTSTLHADHIVPMKTITEMDGFDQLSQEDQLKVLNYPDNFVGLSETANTSKGAKSYSEWTQYKKGGITVDPTFKQEMIQKTQEMQIALPNYIKSLLGK